MDLSISHTTHYRFDQPVSYALQQVRLRPCDDPLQKVVNWGLQIEGGTVAASYTDHHGNLTDLIVADPDATEVILTAAGQIRTSNTLGILGQVYGAAPLWYWSQATELTQPGGAITALSRTISNLDDPLDDLHRLSARILSDLPYASGHTYADTPAEKALQASGGVCQDHAQIMIAAVRAAGLPARYVSGYLMMNDRVEQDASHAWAEVHTPTLGWVGFDVSNGISPDPRYVRIATGRDARDAAPVRGMRLGQSHETMIVSLQVQQ